MGGWIGVAPLVGAALVAATTNVYAAGVADLAVTKTGPATAVQDTTFNYHITVTNNGPDPATNVTLTDRLPTGISFGDVLATVHRLLRREREYLRLWIANLSFDREHHTPHLAQLIPWPPVRTKSNA